jgi:hypothetical protein
MQRLFVLVYIQSYPLWAGKGVTDDTKFYNRREYACQAPVNKIKEALSQMQSP